MAMVDQTGRLVRFTIRPGNAAEAPELTTLLDGVSTSELIADKACDSDPIRLALASDSILATIPPRVNRRVQHWYDPIRYRTLHLVENYFCDIKQFRAVATRYNKLGDSYCAMVNLASWIIETRSTRRTAKAPVPGDPVSELPEQVSPWCAGACNPDLPLQRHSVVVSPSPRITCPARQDRLNKNHCLSVSVVRASNQPHPTLFLPCRT